MNIDKHHSLTICSPNTDLLSPAFHRRFACPLMVGHDERGLSPKQTGRNPRAFHRGASVGWASTRGCWRHQMDPFLVLSLFNAAPYLTLDECWVITPFITQITLKNYSTLKCFTTMKEIFLYQHDGKLILCLIRQLDFTLSHSQSEFPTRQETIFVLFLDWIMDACNYRESGSIFMAQ